MNVRPVLAALLCGAITTAALAQVTPAAGVTPPDDNPTFKVGATIFADYTYQQSPETTDADKNNVNVSSFNVSRAYINVTGSLNHLISYRITPDISRETGSGSSLSGSQTFRLKYAFAQLNLDDWATHGTWLRLGVQQTPYVDYTEGIYRYRFQGTIFAEREGLISSADAGFSGHYNFPGNYGDVHAGVYNGENYNKAETNDQKAFQLRATVRPLPLGGIWKGLRITAFLDTDHYVQDAKRRRFIGQATFEHPLANVGFDYVRNADRTSVSTAEVDGKGYSVWATPRFGASGFEMLLRHDDFKPSAAAGSQKRKRDIAGLAYWMPNLNKVTAALMLDYDSLKQSGFAPSRANDTRYGVKLLVNF
jgi:hypothetical protein